MTEEEIKSLKWSPDPSGGYTVSRRPDGGMTVHFSKVTLATLQHWRDFALGHLLDSDRLTRNLYDLSQITALPDEAIQYAIEVNNDPSARNIRLAVVAPHPEVRAAVEKIADLTVPGGVEMEIFDSLPAAETWLARPLTYLV